jgi:hypothetical protein
LKVKARITEVKQQWPVQPSNTSGGGFTSEKVAEISKTFDTHFPGEQKAQK